MEVELRRGDGAAARTGLGQGAVGPSVFRSLIETVRLVKCVFGVAVEQSSRRATQTGRQGAADLSAADVAAAVISRPAVDADHGGRRHAVLAEVELIEPGVQRADSGLLTATVVEPAADAAAFTPVDPYPDLGQHALQPAAGAEQIRPVQPVTLRQFAVMGVQVADHGANGKGAQVLVRKVVVNIARHWQRGREGLTPDGRAGHRDRPQVEPLRPDTQRETDMA